jgi:hypothetical protein
VASSKAAKIDYEITPSEYKQNFSVLAQRDPAEAADVALKWRERFINQTRAMRETTGALLEIGVGGGFAALWGGLDGGWEAEREKAIEDWELSGAAEVGTTIEEHPEPWDHKEGVSDPTKLFGFIDKVLAGTLVLAALAVFNVLGNRWQPLLRSAALGSFSYWAGNLTNKIFKARKKEALAKKAEEEAAAP